MTETAPEARAREWLGLCVLMLPAMLIAVDGTVLGFALPSLNAQLHPSATETLWIVDVYGFVLASLLVTMGNLGDRFGRRRLLIIGSAGFGAFSVLCAYSPHPHILILGRALLGLAGATLMPSTMSLLRTMFLSERQRMFAIAVWGVAFSAGGAFGPVIGGWLLTHFWWGSIFLINVPVVLVTIACLPFLIDESKNLQPGKIDLPSVGLSLIAMLSSIYGLKEIATSGFTASSGIAVFLGIAMGVIFVRRQRTLESPLLDLALLRNRRFSLAVAISTIAVTVIIGTQFLIPQYLQLVLDIPTNHASWYLLPGSLASIPAGFIAAALTRHLSERTIIVVGLLFVSIGMFFIFFMTVENGAWLVLISGIFLGFGFGATMTVISAIVLGAAPPERAGAASALSETALESGIAIGVAVFGSIVNAVYHYTFPVPSHSSSVLTDPASETLTKAIALGFGSEGRPAFVNGLWTANAVGMFFLVGMIFLLMRSPSNKNTPSPDTANQ